MKTKVKCICDFPIIDDDLMSLNEIGFLQGFFERDKKVFAIVIVGDRLKYCPITGLQVL